MSNIYSPEAQAKIDAADNKLGDAIKNLRSQIKPEIEIIPNDEPDIDVEISAPKEKRRSDFVQTDDPKILERINDLYGQVKKSDAAKQMLIEHNRLLEQKQLEYEERLNKFERTTKDTASDKVESELKAKLRQAREEHDLDTIEQIEDKLLDLRLEKRITPTTTSKPVTQNPVQQQADNQFLNNAAYIKNLSEEKDSNGNLVRPYLYDWHPDNQKAVELFQNIPREFQSAGKQVDIKTIVEVLDERMQGKKRNGSSAVLSGDGDISEKRTIRLTQAQADVAKRMGISTEAYARQLSTINS